ncbi:hypothetical protein T12_16864 [Trichinella patagoniensis]|uniref:Uncharacterized protein n=1 Tax=Trichinella patagoniensis TaxID=990121 RepID=A0A0V0YPU8_9BILA|nr:hypothetical protein T12_16864 [Trichinella patagoniensis]
MKQQSCANVLATPGKSINPVSTFIWGPEKTDVLSGKT